VSGPKQNIRPSAVAGQFYPKRASELRLQVEDLLARACDAEIEGEIRGLIAPHAGYAFSGQTAAAAYRQIRGRTYDTAVVMAPSHRDVCDGVSIFPGDGYETPLGVVPVDVEMIDRLLEEDASLKKSSTGHAVGASQSPSCGHSGEHAVEVQIPFLQIVLPQGLRLLPIVMDCRSFETCRRLADALVRASEGRRILIVASSDLYHGYSREACVKSDDHTLETLESADPQRFSDALEKEMALACGGGPIVTMMEAARQLGASQALVVARTNSGEVTGERAGYVVGYGAALLYSPERASGLVDSDRAQLGMIARRSVEDTACGRVSEDPVLNSPGLGKELGAFVTLRNCGRLRGCIGDTDAHDPLAQTVQKMASAAASRDPRFPPVSKDELGVIEIEISVLGPVQPVMSAADITVGKHGLCVRKGTNQGVLLPQVAVEQGWDKTEFLNQATLKANLPQAAWKEPDAEIWTFTAEVISV